MEKKNWNKLLTVNFHHFTSEQSLSFIIIIIQCYSRHNFCFWHFHQNMKMIADIQGFYYSKEQLCLLPRFDNESMHNSPCFMTELKWKWKEFSSSEYATHSCISLQTENISLAFKQILSFLKLICLKRI